jgi:hypothetical protein
MKNKLLSLGKIPTQFITKSKTPIDIANHFMNVLFLNLSPIIYSLEVNLIKGIKANGS